MRIPEFRSRSRASAVATGRPKKKFKRFLIGFFHIDIAEVRTGDGKNHRFVAVERTSKFAYPSQRESRYDPALRRAENTRSRFDWIPGVANGHGGKPKGMHWRTYHRLCDEHDRRDAVSWADFLKRFVEHPDFGI